MNILVSDPEVASRRERSAQSCSATSLRPLFKVERCGTKTSRASLPRDKKTREILKIFEILAAPKGTLGSAYFSNFYSPALVFGYSIFWKSPAPMILKIPCRDWFKIPCLFLAILFTCLGQSQARMQIAFFGNLNSPVLWFGYHFLWKPWTNTISANALQIGSARHRFRVDSGIPPIWGPSLLVIWFRLRFWRANDIILYYLQTTHMRSNYYYLCNNNSFDPNLIDTRRQTKRRLSAISDSCLLAVDPGLPFLENEFVLPESTHFS